jgi:hypothetical protein
MGSIPLDNGESVYIHDGTGSADPVAISAAEGSSLANLMAKRERFDFTWADSGERTGQTGMVQGSRGYQEDNKTEYLYDNSSWRLALPYAEYTASQTNVLDGVISLTGNYVVDATQTTDTTMVTIPSNGTIRFVNAGIYAVQSTTEMRNSADNAWAPITARSFVDLDTTALVPIHRQSAGAGEDQMSFSMANVRIPSNNYDLVHVIYKVNGNATTLCKTRLRIARLG